MGQRTFSMEAAFYGPHFQVFERLLHNSKIEKKIKSGLAINAHADCVELL